MFDGGQEDVGVLDDTSQNLFTIDALERRTNRDILLGLNGGFD